MNEQNASIKPYVIGLDLGGTNSVFGIVDARGEIKATTAIKTGGYDKVEDYVDACVEALQVIKEVSPEIPVVMLSSAGSPQKLMTTLKMGAMEFIQKPYKSEQIQKVVETIRKKVGLDG